MGSEMCIRDRSNVLQLWGTPWVKRVDKRDLQIWPTQKSNMFVYVQVVFVRGQSKPQLARRTSRNITIESRETMLRLAIVLLELCFGERIESQPFRSNYLGPEGQPSDLTGRFSCTLGLTSFRTSAKVMPIPIIARIWHIVRWFCASCYRYRHRTQSCTGLFSCVTAALAR